MHYHVSPEVIAEVGDATVFLFQWVKYLMEKIIRNLLEPLDGRLAYKEQRTEKQLSSFTMKTGHSPSHS